MAGAAKEARKAEEERAVTALFELMLATATDDPRDRSVWLRRHAPNGDADRAVFIAWCAETDPTALIEASLRPVRAIETWDEYRAADGCRCGPIDEPFSGVACPECCGVLRARLTCPTFASLLESRR